MSKMSFTCLTASLLLGLAIPVGSASAQDNDSSVDCFYAANTSNPLCLSQASATPAAKSARAGKSKVRAPEYGEAMAESVDCFYAHNATAPGCATKNPRSAAISRQQEHIVRSKANHGG